jgi:hypothetical protein
MNKALLKYILIAIGVLLLLFGGYVYMIASAFDFGDGKFYSKQDLINHYKAKTQEIQELKRYINSIVPPGKVIDIEFEGEDKLAIFHVEDNGIYDSNWDLGLSSSKVDTLLQKLNWTKENLQVLKVKLDSAGCISVKSGEPCNIGFQRSGMGKYFYNLFDGPVSDSLRTQYNRSCTHVFYTDRIVLEYGGGAIGPQCFPMDTVEQKQRQPTTSGL